MIFFLVFAVLIFGNSLSEQQRLVSVLIRHPSGKTQKVGEGPGITSSRPRERRVFAGQRAGRPRAQRRQGLGNISLVVVKCRNRFLCLQKANIRRQEGQNFPFIHPKLMFPARRAADSQLPGLRVLSGLRVAVASAGSRLPGMSVAATLRASSPQSGSRAPWMPSPVRTLCAWSRAIPHP